MFIYIYHVRNKTGVLKEFNTFLKLSNEFSVLVSRLSEFQCLIAIGTMISYLISICILIYCNFGCPTFGDLTINMFQDLRPNRLVVIFRNPSTG